MSRDEAHRRTGTTPPTPEEAVSPQYPLFTARTDPAAGIIRTRGHLDEVGADVLCRMVTALQQQGQRRIVVRLGTATVADDAHALLADHARLLRADEVSLLITRRPPF